MRITTYPCACGARSAIEHPPTGCPDKEHGTPCLVCGAPILDGMGHDDGCTVEEECRCDNPALAPAERMARKDRCRIGMQRHWGDTTPEERAQLVYVRRHWGDLS